MGKFGVIHTFMVSLRQIWATRELEGGREGRKEGGRKEGGWERQREKEIDRECN